MSLGFWEVVILIAVLMIVILFSRYQTKRICPKCGFAIKSYTKSCPECGMVFPKKRQIQNKQDG
jgi:tRNA(Ile2) C34 agmatinyltransferase TiaS